MQTYRNKKYMISMIEHSDYIAILGSLLIGFVIAWIIWQPSIHETSYQDHGAAPALERSLPQTEVSGPTASPNTLPKDEQELR